MAKKCSRTLHGCVDWNNYSRLVSFWVSISRTLHGCVDWNSSRGCRSDYYCLSHPSWVRGLKYYNFFKFFSCTRSHPSWVRGLKSLLNCSIKGWTTCRTLHGCVDWNRGISYNRLNNLTSHPSWVRGLKWLNFNNKKIFNLSHPSWVRGLKLLLMES